ncbi:MAG: sugar phosphate isomerase/epimerase [Clostridia bacterium]|nr:sugar phosphate isomerase/epimerase [Clostridia bacterium]
MFAISIGTIIWWHDADRLISFLNGIGCECYELEFAPGEALTCDYAALKGKLEQLLDGRFISSVALYGNPILSEDDRRATDALIRGAEILGVPVLGCFAGGNPELSVPDNIPAFKTVWEPLAETAGEHGVRIGFEGCGHGWKRGCTNIAYNGDAWELMFDALPTPALGLEWEPCHALEILADPVAQLRRWAKRVVHLHGKDASVCWDLIRDHGIDSPEHVIYNRTPGFGDSDWPMLFTILLQNGFRGACDIEGHHDPVHRGDMDWTGQTVALDYLKRSRGGLRYVNP